jgi:DNA topoisomerase I
MMVENVLIAGIPDEAQSARLAGLRYTMPGGPGIQRKRSGRGFVYIGPDRKPIKDELTLERIRALVLPPAWQSVWINPLENGHIQAVGRDARGRKQYRYHSRYRAFRDQIKFERMRAFGRALPKIRRTVRRDLRRPGLPKRKVLAAVVKLLETTFIRVGNEEYTEENNSYGLTTLRNRHVEVLGSTLKFRFVGKSHQQHEIKVEDKRLARIVRQCRDMPGSALFEYVDEDGTPQAVDSGDVNEYLREISGGDFTAKDFRTWGGTCLAAEFLHGKCIGDGTEGVKKALVEVVKDVATKLGNKPSTCKKYYIHPAVMDCFESGTLRVFAEKCQSNGRGIIYERLVASILAPARRSKKAA